MKEPDWAEVRRRARRRAGAKMALIIAPIGILVTIIRMLQPHKYPAADIRNEPVFWMVFGGAMLVLLGALMIGSILTLAKR